jgi:hypothetical protein
MNRYRRVAWQRNGLTVSAALLYALVAASACRSVSPPETEGGKSAQTDVAIVDLAFYAWYYYADAGKVRYHELTAFPVDDDRNQYPAFDIVVTVRNNGSEHVHDLSLKVVLAFEIGPINRDRPAESPESSYDKAKAQATWRRPEWAKRFDLASLAPGEEYAVRVGCVSMADIWQRYWRKGQWPYRGRIDAFVNGLPGEGNRTNNRMQRYLRVDMLD